MGSVSLEPVPARPPGGGAPLPPPKPGSCQEETMVAGTESQPPRAYLSWGLC